MAGPTPGGVVGPEGVAGPAPGGVVGPGGVAGPAPGGVVAPDAVEPAPEGVDAPVTGSGAVEPAASRSGPEELGSGRLPELPGRGASWLLSMPSILLGWRTDDHEGRP